jgi:hypothetical protein
MTGEFLTRATAWLAIFAYTAGTLIFVNKSTRGDGAARLLWTIACASLIAHFISAFQFFHGWSHQAAYLATARQTEKVFGLNWGGGLLINYLVLILWIVDVTWWWVQGVESYRRRRWRWVIAWHALLIFIIFNATVVFGHGIIRWLGGVACLILVVAWIRISKKFDVPEFPIFR